MNDLIFVLRMLSGMYGKETRVTPSTFGSMEVSPLVGDQPDLDNPTEADKKWIQKINDSLISCCLLMTAAVFEWWKGHAEKYGIEYEHVHHDGSLKTS